MARLCQRWQAPGRGGDLPDKKAQRNPARCLVRPEQASCHGSRDPAMQFARKSCPYTGSLRPGCRTRARAGAGEQSCCLGCSTGRASGSRQAQPSLSSAWATLPSPGTCCRVSGRLDAAYTNRGTVSAVPVEALLQKGTRSLSGLQAIQSKACVCVSPPGAVLLPRQGEQQRAAGREPSPLVTRSKFPHFPADESFLSLFWPGLP